MDRRGRTLADGTLPLSRQVLYTVPDGMVAEIHWISVFNGTGSSVQCTFSVRRFGEVRSFGRMLLDASGGHGRVVDTEEGLVLAEGDAIEATEATGGSIQYMISGLEEPAGGEEE